jgi:quinol monooxygenase YgiN
MGALLLEGLAAALVETRAYDGCLSVETFVDADSPDNVWLIEEWATRGHQERYMAWRVESGMMELVQPILAGPVEIHFLDARPI